MTRSDLDVDLLSSALAGKILDVVVSGSIGAIESPRFLRALRRLGAQVKPWLTRGGAQFTTPTALGWAAASDTGSDFNDSADHIAKGDACIIAPASAHFIEKIVSGRMDTPSSALVQSYLGQKKPVIVIPNMHDSLAQSPFIERNLIMLKNFATVIEPRREEHKLKFPDPQTAALQCAHIINLKRRSILVTLGTTRSYFDEVRYLSNDSTGAMGTELCRQAFAKGFDIQAVVGPCVNKPHFLPSFCEVTTVGEMLEAVRGTRESVDAAVFVAAVLDYEFKEKIPEKVRSSRSEITATWFKTPKVIEIAKDWPIKKFAFKYETDAGTGDFLEKTAQSYIARYHLQGCLVNLKKHITVSHHRGILFDQLGQKLNLNSRLEIAEKLLEMIEQ